MPVHPLRVYRTASGLSQKELAREAGLARSTIIRIEHGEAPTVRTANAIAHVLGKPTEALFGPRREADD